MGCRKIGVLRKDSVTGVQSRFPTRKTGLRAASYIALHGQQQVCVYQIQKNLSRGYFQKTAILHLTTDNHEAPERGVEPKVRRG
jgi:uncharacterized protein YoaH (UPF0181 family)